MRHAGAHRRQRQASVAGLLAAIVAAAGLGFFYLSQSTHVAAVGYEIDALQAQIETLKAEQQQLILGIGAAKSPSGVLHRATSQMGLQPLSSGAVTFATPSSTGAHSAGPSSDSTR